MRPPRHKASHAKTTNPSGHPGGVRASLVLYAGKPPSLQKGNFLTSTEMATTVGTTLASSKLAVTQDDLHLIGSSVDQLIVQCDQMAFDELLAADQIRARKRRCPETRETAIGAAASSSSTRSA